MLAGTVVKRLPLGEKVAGSNPVASIEKKVPNCDRFEFLCILSLKYNKKKYRFNCWNNNPRPVF